MTQESRAWGDIGSSFQFPSTHSPTLGHLVVTSSGSPSFTARGDF